MTSGFAAALSDAMKVKGWDIAKLSKELDVSYEYARRLTTGQSFPSRFMLKGICKMLDLDQGKMWNLVVSDKIQRKYGSSSRPDSSRGTIGASLAPYNRRAVSDGPWNG